MKIAGAPLAKGPRKAIGPPKPKPLSSAMISTRISPMVTVGPKASEARPPKSSPDMLVPMAARSFIRPLARIGCLATVIAALANFHAAFASYWLRLLA